MKLHHHNTARILLLALLLAATAVFAGGSGVVNVNTAGLEQLSYLPRVGPSIAARIVDFREENGPFKTTEDLMLVRGIGEKTYELIKPYVAVSGQTTLKEKVRGARSSGETSKDEPEGSR